MISESVQPSDSRAGVAIGLRAASRRTLVLIGIGVVISAVLVLPVVAPAVDWGMDGDLTPGDWELRQWLGGAIIAAFLLGLYSTPVLLLVLIACAVVFLRSGLQRSRHCPRCDAVVDTRSGRCPLCGPLPPRRRGRSASNGLLRLGGLIATAAVLFPVVVLLSSGVSWVYLECEEDAFGERARAAAAAGANSHQERSACGSTLTWTDSGGYSSHRD